MADERQQDDCEVKGRGESRGPYKRYLAPDSTLHIPARSRRRYELDVDGDSQCTGQNPDEIESIINNTSQSQPSGPSHMSAEHHPRNSGAVQDGDSPGGCLDCDDSTSENSGRNEPISPIANSSLSHSNSGIMESEESSSPSSQDGDSPGGCLDCNDSTSENSGRNESMSPIDNSSLSHRNNSIMESEESSSPPSQNTGLQSSAQTECLSSLQQPCTAKLSAHDGNSSSLPEERHVCEDDRSLPLGSDAIVDATQDSSADEGNHDDSDDILSVWSNEDDENESSEVQNASTSESDESSNQIQEEPDHQPQLTSFFELQKKLDGEYAAPITANIAVCPGEIFLMVLSMARQNKLSVKATLDTLNLVNTIFNVPILPKSLYFLDKILDTDSIVERHFFCYKCTASFGKINHTLHPVKECTNCHQTNYLQDLTKASYFVIFDVPIQLELLFSNDEIRNKLLNPKEAGHASNLKNCISDIYNGTCYKNFVSKLDHSDNTSKVISMIFNTDGSPVFSSSKFSLWPALLSINELPPSTRMQNVLLCGLWCGSKKPPMDLFLTPIVNHLASLSNPGFKIKVGDSTWNMKAYTIGCCVDSGARGAVQCVNSHSGYFACNWCLHPGEWIENLGVRYTIPTEVPLPRTHRQLLAHGQECLQDPRVDYIYGVRGVTSLACLIPDAVDGMVVDFPHCVCFGLGRVNLQEWLNKARCSWYIGTPDNIAKLDKRMSLLTPPTEVRRLPRPISDNIHWKAREFENWILFFSIPVLQGVLPSKYLNHWQCLVQAVYFLLLDNIDQKQVDIAHKLLCYFMFTTEELYGKEHMTFNTHIASHLAENVSRWGPAWAVSTYCFEDQNGELKGLVNSQHGVVHQIDRALAERQAVKLLQHRVGSPRTAAFIDNLKPKKRAKKFLAVGDDCYLFGTPNMFKPEPHHVFLCNQLGGVGKLTSCVVYGKLIHSSCVYTNDKTRRSKLLNNSVAKLKSGEITVIKEIVYDPSSQRVLLFCVDVNLLPILKLPSGIVIPTQDHCVRIVDSVSRRMRLVTVGDLKTVCVKSVVDGKEYITPFPNIFNVC